MSAPTYTTQVKIRSPPAPGELSLPFAATSAATQRLLFTSVILDEFLVLELHINGIVQYCTFFTDSVIWTSFHICTKRASLLYFPAAWRSVAWMDHAFCSLSLIHLNIVGPFQPFTSTNVLRGAYNLVRISVDTRGSICWINS